MTLLPAPYISEVSRNLLAADHEITFCAFGVEVTLTASQDTASRDHKLTELRNLYEPFLASRVLPRKGLCVDLGAAEGWFAIPFARAFPQWEVLCFENDPVLARRLRNNIAMANISNVTVIEAALHPDAPAIELPKRDQSEPRVSKAIWTALQNSTEASFDGSLGMASVSVAAETGSQSRPALPVDVLAQIAPDFLKLDAPGCEGYIASSLKQTRMGRIVGPLWSYQPSELFQPSTECHEREFYLLYGPHALRRDFEDNFESRRPGLDIVVALYNAQDHIVECIDSLLVDAGNDTKILVVDDGSTDGSGDLVRAHYKDVPNVEVLRKANGGAASARNYGRQASTASHIAFVDADDRVDPGLFQALLEVARYTGAPVTEAEFCLLSVDGEGVETFEPSYEQAGYPTPGEVGLGPFAYHRVEGHRIAMGQPAIWRRVHRRDFLDRYNIWFPEHVRAFDDQIFQLLLSRYCGEVPHVTGFNYHYRQHEGQDIKQGDERHFYSFNMYRSIFLRSIDENWATLDPVYRSLLNTLAWSYHGLRNDLKSTYRKAASEFLAITQMTFGHKFAEKDLVELGIEGLDILLAARLAEFGNAKPNYAYMRTENWMWQPEFIRMMDATQTK